MKTSQTLIATLREVPAEAVIASHQLMLRAGLLRKLGNGLFAYLPFGLRAFRKVENIIREEMNNIGALEFRPSVVVPGELWRESGRWETMGAGMLRVTNRVDQELVVSPTAEEAFTSLIRDELSSYKQLPITAYQINTKYRDEIRPRYGVMRGREFTMKDAYSFHADQKSLDETYDNFAIAYRKIFKRLGLSVIPVRADAGAMGGTGSEEFMVESAVGDDTLILCPSCGYAANTEKAACAQDTPLNAEGKPQQKTDKPKEAIDTPNVRTIEELSSFLKTNPQTFIKTLIYKVLNSELDLTKAPGCASLKRVTDTGDAAKFYPVSFFAVCIRGDLDVNEAKLASLLKASEVELACDDDVVRITNAPVGFAGPAGLSSVPVIADESVLVMHDAVTGGLAKDVHFIHVEPGRDFTPFMSG
ncbi:MAG: proline--tRNA ligase, partial [Spirochaetaceae bacterium]|nr:proline--tRNA ligase [Spirochaetaceae bacterium]